MDNFYTRLLTNRIFMLLALVVAFPGLSMARAPRVKSSEKKVVEWNG